MGVTDGNAGFGSSAVGRISASRRSGSIRSRSATIRRTARSVILARSVTDQNRTLGSFAS